MFLYQTVSVGQCNSVQLRLSDGQQELRLRAAAKPVHVLDTFKITKWTTGRAYFYNDFFVVQLTYSSNTFMEILYIWKLPK